MFFEVGVPVGQRASTAAPPTRTRSRNYFFACVSRLVNYDSQFNQHLFCQLRRICPLLSCKKPRFPMQVPRFVPVRLTYRCDAVRVVFRVYVRFVGILHVAIGKVSIPSYQRSNTHLTVCIKIWVMKEEPQFTPLFVKHDIGVFYLSITTCGAQSSSSASRMLFVSFTTVGGTGTSHDTGE